MDTVPAVFQLFQTLHRCAEEEGDLLFKFFVQVSQNNIVDIRSQMTDRSIQELELVLDA